jgi:hypothetical protein
VLAVGRPVFERATAGGLEGRPARPVGLQEKVLAHDDGDEDLVHIKPPTAEHALGSHRAERGEQFAAPGDDLGGGRCSHVVAQCRQWHVERKKGPPGEGGPNISRGAPGAASPRGSTTEISDSMRQHRRCRVIGDQKLCLMPKS